MKNLILLFVLNSILFIPSVIAQEEPEKITYLENDTVVYHYPIESKTTLLKGRLINNLKQGTWYAYFDKSYLTDIRTYVNDTIHGKFIRFYANGNIYEESIIYKGMYDGEVKRYFENKQLANLSTYSNNNRNGKSLDYFENGKLQAELVYRNDTPIGIAITYDEAGNIASKENYDSLGLMLGKQYYYNEGIINSVNTYRNDTLNGEEITFFTNGKTKEILFYQNGLIHGPYISYYKNEKYRLVGDMVNGKYDGGWKSYYETGEIEFEATYDNGIGHKIVYDIDGKILNEGPVFNEEKTGTWTHYKKNGKVKYYEEISYSNNYFE